MSLEIAALLGVCLYGAVQAFAAGGSATLQQVHRNFSETFYLFGAGVLALGWLGAFGPWSSKGAVTYAAGRAIYLALSIAPLRRFRKWAWAISMAGVVGVLAELIRAVAP